MLVLLRIRNVHEGRFKVPKDIQSLMPSYSFTYRDLLEVGRRYHGKRGWTKRETRAEEVYRQEVLGRKSTNPDKLVKGALRFLGHWNALRFKNGTQKVKDVVPRWLLDNQPTLDALRGRELHSLKEEDFIRVLYLAGSLIEEDIPPTTYGKLLHFFLPETVLLWDLKIVRNRYNLDSDPYSFAVYQSFGWRLLNLLAKQHGKPILTKIRKEHASVSGCQEPLTKLVDELAYNNEIRKKAVRALENHDEAFWLAPLIAKKI